MLSYASDLRDFNRTVNGTKEVLLDRPVRPEACHESRGCLCSQSMRLQNEEPSESGDSLGPATKLRNASYFGNNSLTIDFSSLSSFTVASILERLNSFQGTPCTISSFCPLLRIGNEQI